MWQKRTLTLILLLRKKNKRSSRNFRRGRLLIWAVLPLLSPYLVRCERERVCHRASAHSSYIKNQKYKKNHKTRKKYKQKIYFYCRVPRWSRISGQIWEVYY